MEELIQAYLSCPHLGKDTEGGGGRGLYNG